MLLTINNIDTILEYFELSYYHCLKLIMEKLEIEETRYLIRNYHGKNLFKNYYH